MRSRRPKVQTLSGVLVLQVLDVNAGEAPPPMSITVKIAETKSENEEEEEAVFPGIDFLSLADIEQVTTSSLSLLPLLLLHFLSLVLSIFFYILLFSSSFLCVCLKQFSVLSKGSQLPLLELQG